MSNETKWTPGPWEYKKGNATSLYPIVQRGEQWMAVKAKTREREEADARLIAAAPDLYEALERTLNWLASYPGGGTMRPGGVWEQAHAALARARGES